MIDIIALLLTITTCYCGYLTYRKLGTLFSLGVFFNAYSILYFVLGILIYKYDINSGAESDSLIILAQLSLIAVFSFNLVYIPFSRPRAKTTTANTTPPSHQTVLLTFLIAVTANFFVLYQVGFLAYFFIDRLDRFPIMKEYQKFLFIAKMANIALILFMYRYYVFQQKRDKRMAIIVSIYCLAFAVLTISRSELAFLFITIFFFAEKLGLVSTRKLIFYGVSMASLMLVYKGALYIILLGDTGTSAYNPGEFINWIRNSIIMLEGGYNSNDLPNNSYLLAIKSIFLIDPGGDALSEWFIERFYPDKVVLGLTYGFSGVIEGYLYLNELGVFLHFAMIGALFCYLESKTSALNTALSIAAMYIMFRLFRSEIYNFARTFTWYFVYQVAIIFLIDTTLKFATKNLKRENWASTQ